jgi:hypothetical protein
MRRLILLGDSIFDNRLYVDEGETVIDQIRPRLPAGWCADLRAVDGATCADVSAQLGALPTGSTHLLVSVGGNDALQQRSVLAEQTGSVADALMRLGEIRDDFAIAYDDMLEAVAASGLPYAVCTIYDPAFADPEQRRLSALALTFYNDAILRIAGVRSVHVLDLRAVCTEDADFVHEIEPSRAGASKIASAILRHISVAGFAEARCNSNEVEGKAKCRHKSTNRLGLKE